MNFTREPIIETIITPKEGFKLAVKNSKGVEQEEYYVDAVEVVSFGSSCFFRSLERPKPFLVPVSDFEVVEVKETRVVLKNASPERAIKIGGGREAPQRGGKEPHHERVPEVPSASEETLSEKESAEQPTMEHRPLEGRMDKKKDRHRRRRRGRSEERHEPREAVAERGKPFEERSREPEQTPSESTEEGGGADDETHVSSSMFGTLFPPPPKLISETISKYKDKDSELPQGDLLPKQVENVSGEDSEEEKKRKKKEEEPPPNTESQELHRSSLNSNYYEGSSFSSTHFYRSDSDENNFLS